MDQFTIRIARWREDSKAIMQIRYEVFVQEQNVPPDLESDDFDAISWYVLAETHKINDEATNDKPGTAIACARLQPNGKITRMAVLKPWRRRGVGRQILQKLLEIADDNNLQDIYLHAQLSAADLYRKSGFIETGNQFEEAGIKHIKMTRDSQLLKP